MTDYALPTTAAEALRARAKGVQFQIKAHKEKVRQHQAVIEELERQEGGLQADADMYEKYQPMLWTIEAAEMEMQRRAEASS